MTDEDLDDRLRQHFVERLRRPAAQAPPFQATLAAAEQRHAPGGRARQVGTWLVPAAAALLLAWLWWPQSSRVDALPSPDALVAELTSGTHWQAPSDRWLEPPATPAYLGLPRLGDGDRILEVVPLR